MDDDADIALMLGADPQHADDKLAEKIQKYKMLSNKLDDRKCIPAYDIKLQLWFAYLRLASSQIACHHNA